MIGYLKYGILESEFSEETLYIYVLFDSRTSHLPSGGFCRFWWDGDRSTPPTTTTHQIKVALKLIADGIKSYIVIETTAIFIETSISVVKY